MEFDVGPFLGYSDSILPSFAQSHSGRKGKLRTHSAVAGVMLLLEHLLAELDRGPGLDSILLEAPGAPVAIPSLRSTRLFILINCDYSSTMYI
jgi:hypothetical protein